jgi:hypothetical protein
VLLGRFLEKQMSKWNKMYDEREQLLADAKEAAERNTEGEYVGHANILRPATVSLNRSNAHLGVASPTETRHYNRAGQDDSDEFVDMDDAASPDATIGDDDEDGKREGLSSSMWVSAVQAYVCTHMCAYVRVRVCVCVYVFKLTLVGSVYMYVWCIVL